MRKNLLLPFRIVNRSIQTNCLRTVFYSSVFLSGFGEFIEIVCKMSQATIIIVTSCLISLIFSSSFSMASFFAETSDDEIQLAPSVNLCSPMDGDLPMEIPYLPLPSVRDREDRYIKRLIRPGAWGPSGRRNPKLSNLSRTKNQQVTK